MYLFNFSKPCKGQSLIEYALILAGVALLIFILVTAYGNELRGIYNLINNTLYQ